jgi:ATP phosphoribosyltransferase
MMIIAIPTGRLGNQLLTYLYQKKVTSSLFEPGRLLSFKDEAKQLTFIFVKPSDVITYVERGDADVGMVGSDLLSEKNRPIYDLMDLNIGICSLIVAGLNPNVLKQEVIQVATKYPFLAQQYFASKNQATEIVYLNGSVELAPLMDVADVIVDITETGKTLKDNGLTIFDTIMNVSAHVVTSRATYILKHDAVSSFITQLRRPTHATL